MSRTLLIGGGAAIGVAALVAAMSSGDPAKKVSMTYTSLVQRAIASAQQQLGMPYVPGGERPADGGFDCSGFIWYVWNQAGLTKDWTRTTADALWHGAGRIVSLAALQPGDLIFYENDDDPAVDHVALYVGNGKTIHAPRPGKVVTESTVYGPGAPLGARRLSTTATV